MFTPQVWQHRLMCPIGNRISSTWRQKWRRGSMLSKKKSGIAFKESVFLKIKANPRHWTVATKKLQINRETEPGLHAVWLENSQSSDYNLATGQLGQMKSNVLSVRAMFLVLCIWVERKKNGKKAKQKGEKIFMMDQNCKPGIELRGRHFTQRMQVPFRSPVRSPPNDTAFPPLFFWSSLTSPPICAISLLYAWEIFTFASYLGKQSTHEVHTFMMYINKCKLKWHIRI